MLHLADHTTKPMGLAGVVARLRGIGGAHVPMACAYQWTAISTSNATVRPTGPPGALTG